MKRVYLFLLVTAILSGCASSSRSVELVGSYRYRVIIDEPERTLELKRSGRYQLTVFPALVFSKTGEPLPWIELGTWRAEDGGIILKSDSGHSKKASVREGSHLPALEVDGVIFEREEKPNLEGSDSPQRRIGTPVEQALI